MKKALFTLMLFGQVTVAFTQVEIKADLGLGDQTMAIKNNEVTVDPALKELKTFSVKLAALAATEKVIIKVENAGLAAGGAAEYASGDVPGFKSFTFDKNIINKQITIIQRTIASGEEATLLQFTFTQTAAVDLDKAKDKTESKLGSLSDFLEGVIGNYELTQQGWIRAETSGMSEKDKRQQVNITHIFFDEFGNSLLGAVPQGIANRQYVVHIIYQGYTDRQGRVRYSIKQKSGSFNSGLSIANSGALKSLPVGLQSKVEDIPFDAWIEQVFPLGIATDDLVFDIIATTVDDNNKPVKVVLETQTIKMSPVYHATIDIGLINSQLNNPTFALVEAPDASGNQVVKETDRSPKGIVTVMATFYTSPIVLLERLLRKSLKKNIPSYKLTGRSLFDDHSFIERIYPTVGVSVSSKSFENLFFGLNWELARGLSIFGGAHWGKVNTFELPGYVTGTTPVTKEQFDFYQNTKWKVDWAYGAKLDIAIITSLFK